MQKQETLKIIPNLKAVKTGVFGIQGSGKTFFVEHKLSKAFKHPFVYLMHPEDFKTCKRNLMVYIPTKTIEGKIIIDKTPEHLNRVLERVIELIKQRKIDAVIIDEADLFIPKDVRTLQKYPHILDLMDNHRHYPVGSGCAIIYMTRRPQEISTLIVETSENLVLFAIDGKNIKAYMKAIHEDYEILMPQLTKNKHNFIFKTLGEKPKLMSAIKCEDTSSRRKTK